jgi:hypothetical protein
MALRLPFLPLLEFSRSLSWSRIYYRRSVGALQPMTTLYIFFSLYLHTSSCRAPSLTRGLVRILQYTSLTCQRLEGLVSFETLPTLEGQVPVCISPRNRVAHLNLRALGPHFIASYDTQGYGEGVVNRIPMGNSFAICLSLCARGDPAENWSRKVALADV